MDKHKNHISDEQLDELFKSMSEGMSVDFEPASWQQLEGKLQAIEEEKIASKTFWKHKGVVMLMLLLFVGVSGLLVMESRKEVVNSIKKENNKALATHNTKGVTSWKKDKKIGSNISTNQVVIPQKYDREEKLVEAVLAGKTRKENRSGVLRIHAHTTAEPSKADLVPSDDHAIVVEKDSLFTSKNKLLSLDSLTLLVSKNQEPSFGFLSTKPLNTFSNIQLPVIDFVPIISSSRVVAASQKSPFNRKGLVIGLYFSPDISTIANNQVEKVGTNYAVQLEYRFSKRWTLQTGVIRSYKVYEAYGSQYEIPLKWNAGAVPQSVDAVCDMLDLPLNIRYDITQKPDSRFFVSTGLTSYVMLREAYYYTYDVKPAGAHDSWIGTSGPFIASNLNFSFGYEARITNRLTWQAEPFARVPISSIGWSKVNLFTMGTFVSLKYRFK